VAAEQLMASRLRSMTSEYQVQLSHMLRSRSETLADAWYQAIKARSPASYGRDEARRMLAQLAATATGLLCNGSIPRGEAQALGAAFADFRLGPDGWGWVEQSLTRELVSELPANALKHLQPRLAVLTGEMAAGFLQETQTGILRQQEEIRQAYLDALQRAESELRLKDAAIRSSVAAIALWTPEGGITYVNPAFLAMWGYGSDQDVRGTQIRDLLAEDEAWPDIHTSLEQIGGWVGKLTGKRPDGSRFTVLLSASVAMAEGDRPVRLMGSFVDMTFRERVSKMLSERIHRLEILHKIDQAILEARSPREIMAAGLQGITRLIPCKHASVTSCDFEAQELILEAAYSDGVGTEQSENRWSIGGFEEPLGRLQQGQAVLISDLEDYPWRAEAGRILRSAGIGSLMAVPMMADGEMFGYLCLGDEAPGVLSHENIPVARELADSLAVAVRQARLNQSIEQQSKRLQVVMTRLAEAEENERHRVVQVLHDRVGQNLTALGLNLNLVRSQIDSLASPGILARLDDSLALVEETTERTRLVMTDLRPPMLEDYGLVATLHWYGELFSSRTGIPVKVTCERQPHAAGLPRLPDRVERALFRIAQEALTNAARHADPTSVAITLTSNGLVARLTIEDNGTGFDPRRRSVGHQAWNLGLLTMAERAEAIGGHCDIESGPDIGTRVTVEVQR
jgi:PAS domain S-box-containing protein